MRLGLSLLLWLGLCEIIWAHEFWLSPSAYQVGQNDTIAITTRVGENFTAGRSVYLPNRFERFDVVAAGQVWPIAGRIGDAEVTAQVPAGLAVLVAETKDSHLRYKDPAKWPKFVRHKDFAGALKIHTARGFDLIGFQERYRRFAKSLVAVGHGRGDDAAIGLRTEIVALDNPYHLDQSVMRVRVVLEGQPRSHAQVELFERSPDGQVAVTLHRTDATGLAVLPVRRGHTYLVDAVTLLPLANDDAGAGPVWETLWASLTFAVPLQ